MHGSSLTVFMDRLILLCAIDLHVTVMDIFETFIQVDNYEFGLKGINQGAYKQPICLGDDPHSRVRLKPLLVRKIISE